MNAQAPGTTSQDSRGSRASRPGFSGLDWLGIALSAAAVIGAILLIVADLSTLYEIKVVTAVVKSVTGHSNHAWALFVLGLFALPMAYGASRQGSRPAMTALLVIGIVAAIIVLAIDLPDVHKTGVIGERFSDAAASPQSGFFLESLGAVLLIIAGGGGLLLTAPGRDRSGGHLSGERPTGERPTGERPARERPARERPEPRDRADDERQAAIDRRAAAREKRGRELP